MSLFRRYSPWIILALAILWIFSPFLFGGYLITSTYAAKLVHIFFLDGQNFLINQLGVWPNWWPAYFSGYPISLTVNGFLNPVFIVALKLLPVITAHNWLIAVFFFLNLACTYAFLRALGISKAGSVIGCITYATNGLILQWVGVLVFTSVLFILPISLLAILRISEGKRRWWFAWVGIMTYGWIGGFDELIVYYLIAIGAFAFYLLMRDRNGSSLWSTFLKGVKEYLAPLLLSLVLISPWLLSVVYYVTQFSNRSKGLKLEEASSLPLTLSHIIHLFLPRLQVFYGNNLPIPLGAISDSDLFIGAIPLFLILSLIFTWRNVKQRYFIFFVGLLAFGLLMAFRSPLYLLLQPLPVIRWFRWHFKWSFLTVFAASVLVAYAFDAYQDFARRATTKKILLAGSTLLGIVLTGFIAFTAFGPTIEKKIVSYGSANYAEQATAQGLALPRDASYYQSRVRLISASIVENLSLQNPWTAFAIFSWALTLGILLLAAFEKLPVQRWRLAMVLTVVFTNVGIWTGFMAGHPTDFLNKEPDTVAFMHAQNPYRTVPVEADQAATHIPYRIFNFFPDQTIAFLQQQNDINLYDKKTHELMARELLDRNIHTWFRIDAIYDHEPLVDERNVSFLYFVNGTNTRTVVEFENTIKRFASEQNARIMGAMNVKYATAPLTFEGAWKRVHTTPLFDGKVEAHVYENPFVLPRWRFAEEAVWRTATTTDRGGLDRMNEITDFQKTMLVDKRLPSDDAIVTVADSSDTLTLGRYTAGNLTLKTKTRGHRWVFFGETAVPFWRVRIDGGAWQIPYRANVLGQAVLVPPGEHQIEFAYPSFLEQARISLSSFILGR